jgi:hypothetical protein
LPPPGAPLLVLDEVLDALVLDEVLDALVLDEVLDALVLDEVLDALVLDEVLDALVLDELLELDAPSPPLDVLLEPPWPPAPPPPLPPGLLLPPHAGSIAARVSVVPSRIRPLCFKGTSTPEE